MKHLEEAIDKIPSPIAKFIELDKQDNSVKFTVQRGPIKEFGLNGCQARDIILFQIELFKSLNNAFQCRENSLTITKLEEALYWQDARTKDRENRNVEGFNKD